MSDLVFAGVVSDFPLAGVLSRLLVLAGVVSALVLAGVLSVLVFAGVLSAFLVAFGLIFVFYLSFAFFIGCLNSFLLIFSAFSFRGFCSFFYLFDFFGYFSRSRLFYRCYRFWRGGCWFGLRLGFTGFSPSGWFCISNSWCWNFHRGHWFCSFARSRIGSWLLKMS